MKTLVTGGTGFIGSHLVKRLLDEGREVIVASDFSQLGTENLLSLELKKSDIEIRKVDLRDYAQTLRALKGADVVFHLAARIGSLEYLHGSEISELAALQTNLVIDANVFKACLETEAEKLIYTSSAAVYPMDKQFSPNVILSESDLDLKDLDCLQPRTSDAGHRTIDPDGGYGWAKLLGEIQLYWTNGVKAGIARIFNVYGVNEPLGEKAHVVADLVRKAILHPKVEFTIRGDGTQSRDFLYVFDCVDALLKLEQKLSALHESPSNNHKSPLVVNIGSNIPVPISVLAEEIVEVANKDIKINYDTSKSVGPWSRTADIEKARNLLGWEPEVNLKEGLRRTYAWMTKRLKDF